MNKLRLKWGLACADMKYGAKLTWREMKRLWHIRGPYLLISSFLLFVGWSFIPFLGGPQATLVAGKGIQLQAFSLGAIVTSISSFFFAAPHPDRKIFAVGSAMTFFWWLFPSVVFANEGHILFSSICAGGAFISFWDGLLWIRRKKERLRELNQHEL